MNLETRLTKEHWLAVRQNIESQIWTNAVLDSIHHLSDLIRNKSGLMGDGISLVGQAFGGKSPKLKLNRLETETEKNIQAGIEQLLRGVYQGIRNPRSHEKTEDNQIDAESIIVFIDFLLRQIGAAKSVFTVEQCVNQILDDNFVPNERYADLIVSEIPQRYLHAVAVEVFKRKNEIDGKKLRPFYNSIFKILPDEDRIAFLEIVSNELRESSDDSSLKSILQFLNPSNWIELSEVARIRTEHRLLNNLRDGKYNSTSKKCISGALATWSTEFWIHFSNKIEIFTTILGMLNSQNTSTQDYAINFCFSNLDSLSDKPSPRLEALLIGRLNGGDKRIYDALETSWLWRDKLWSANFTEAQKKFIPSQPAFPDDEIPF